MCKAQINGVDCIIYDFKGVWADVYIKEYDLRCTVPADIIEVSAW